MARQHAPAQPLTGALAVSLVFRLPAPKDRRAQQRGPTTRPDVENLIKGLLDAWNGVLYADDAQVVALTATKAYASAEQPEGVHVEVAAAP